VTHNSEIQLMTSLRLGNAPTASAIPTRAATYDLVVPERFDIRATRSRSVVRPAVLRPEQRPLVDAETVGARLEEAGHALLSLPRTGPTTALRQTRHQFVAEALDAYAAADTSRPRAPTPSAAQITRMDQALAWIALIPADKLVLRRIVGCRSLVSPLTGRHLFSWRRLARLLGADHKAISRWHANGIDLIVTALNHDAAIARSWDSVR
jgi:hypothetical protein